MAVKQWITAVFVTLVLVASASADLIRNDDPQELLKAVAEKTFDRIASDRNKIDADPNYLKEVVEDEMMPYVDNMYASKKVLGRYLRDTTKEQRERFYQAFYDYLVATYARAFTQYDEDKHKVTFEPSQEISDDARSAVVNSSGFSYTIRL